MVDVSLSPNDGNPTRTFGKKRGPSLSWLVIHLVVPYCAIPRDYLSDTPLLRAMGFLVSQHGQLGAIPPPLFWAFPPWSTCEVEVRYPPHPLKRGISAILPRYPMEKGKWVRYPPLRYYLERVLRDMGGGISHWAAKVIHSLGFFHSCLLIAAVAAPHARLPVVQEDHECRFGSLGSSAPYRHRAEIAGQGREEESMQTELFVQKYAPIWEPFS